MTRSKTYRVQVSSCPRGTPPEAYMGRHVDAMFEIAAPTRGRAVRGAMTALAELLTTRDFRGALSRRPFLRGVAEVAQ